MMEFVAIVLLAGMALSHWGYLEPGTPPRREKRRS
jgi:hypothetical protein